MAGYCAALLVCLCFFGAAPSAQAQVLYGSVVGTVTDPSGAIIPGATVTLTGTTTGVERSSTADEGGRYSFVNVLPGTYDLKVTAKGFRTFVANGFNVSPNTVQRVDSKLEVGQISEQVTVEATAAALQTEKADTHSEITAKSIENMPIGGYRNYQTLINLVPGATPASLQNSITDTPGRALRTNINGGNANTNITRIDGAASVNVWLPHHVGYVTPEEDIEVVNVTTGSADAEQGMAGSSAITVVTKSGTNDIHGSAFEFHNDQHLNSRNFFQAAGTDKPLAIYNNFGGTVGGPIKKNKLFYFLSYDGTRQRTSSPGFYTVPTSAFESGNFSAVPTVIYDPNTGNPDGTGRTPFAGNIIPTSRISPIAQKIQSYYPGANYGNGALVNNLFASGGPILSRNYFDAKVNYNASDKEQIWGKYGRMWAISGGSAVFGVAGGPGLGGGDPGLGDTLIQVATIGHTRTISPNLILDGVIGYERQGQHLLPNDYGTNYGQQFGIPNANGPDPLQSGFINIGISGYSGFGVPNWMPLARIEESYTHSDNLTYTHGAHEIRAGFDLVRHHLNHWQPEIGNFGPRGGFGFAGGQTALNGGPAPNQYNAYAAFLLGLSNDSEKSLQNILATGREWQFGWYVRDRWQVSRKLTVNIGLRYEYYPLMTRAGYGIERLDPYTNQVYMGGRGNTPMDAGISVSKTLFAPRVGLAYRLDDNTVIRAGYGLNFDPIPFSRPLRGWYPLVINSAFTATNGYNWGTTLSQGVPNPVGPNLSSGVVPLPAGVSERSPWGYIHRGYVQSWNFTLERKLPESVIASIAYVGSHSVHLLADQDINAGYPGSGTANLPFAAQFGRTISTNMWDGYLSSNYNSLQVAVNRSFSHGLMLKGAYTYSKAMDYTDEDGWASVGWNWGPVFQRNRAPAGFDRTQNLEMGWVYELPFGKDKMLAKSGPAAAILGGWQVNGVFAAYTGNPFTIGAPGSSLNAPNNTQTADQVLSTVAQPGNVGPGQVYFDPKAFAAVTGVRFGTSGRNILRAPGVLNTDLDIMREFAVKERAKLQFRAQFFNLANTSHFGGPNNSVTSPAFMQITSAYG
ncbi:MAG: TonB-dependent receptor, partial [Acidobacteria bacterium]|nr:TonB-dependent receptor [Acidobacteriota bacterium]